MVKIYRYLKHVRFSEVFLLSGIPFIGAVSRPFSPGIFSIARFILLGISFSLIVAHAYTFNDWADLANDKFKEYATPSNAARVSSRELLVFSFTLLAAGLACSVLLSFPLFVSGLIISILSFLYSSKQLFLKGVIFASSLIHLLAGTLCYLFGYLLFNKLDGAGTLAGLYFGLLYAAGHLTHEVIDFKGDSLSGYTTNAIKFGAGRMLHVSFGIMTVANIYLIILCIYDFLPLQISVLPFMVLPLHAYLFAAAEKKDINFKNAIDFRNNYRKLYVSMGVAWAALSMIRFSGFSGK